MPSAEQLEQIAYLSDTVLYPEAVAFIRRLVQEQECSPLPASQVNGLLNITNTAKYAELDRFIKHQRDRDWPASRSNIKIFYTELEKTFTTMKNKRLRDEFHLLREGLSTREMSQQIDELMAALTRDFVQHLLAENGLLVVEQQEQKQNYRR